MRTFAQSYTVECARLFEQLEREVTMNATTEARASATWPRDAEIDRWLRDADMCVKLAACGDAGSYTKASELIQRSRTALAAHPPETITRLTRERDEARAVVERFMGVAVEVPVDCFPDMLLAVPRIRPACKHLNRVAELRAGQNVHEQCFDCGEQLEPTFGRAP
jgi:hypothetical protein